MVIELIVSLPLYAKKTSITSTTCGSSPFNRHSFKDGWTMGDSSYFRNPTTRHPFNILTKEIYGD